MTTTTIIPTTDTLTRAMKKAEAMWGEYDCTPGFVPGTFLVQHKKDAHRCYCVETDMNKCNCPAFQYDGACKHQAFVAEYQRITEGEEMADLIAEESGAAQFEAAKKITAEWPTCPIHGPYYASLHGSPMSTCDRCEKWRFI